MNYSWIWPLCLIITHLIAYYMGHNDGREQAGPSDKAWAEVQKHEIDRRYALMAIIDERSRKHE